ncbi:hypothetical protein EJV47_21040 [Hymenobacter gummosus]|uniref:Uncharacterized protein n=1 Tax=Hymenobacter gummosus TaxID=1776032 RepID=A0A3S0HKR7_9BACT|nr:hypothetical protein [Hymenobacter gummosus]RTQ46859.1 hypothetical protein EJV47_21040 [Hymenobacter gummosus]
MPESVHSPLNHWCILRVYAEPNGPVAALILVTHTRRGTDVREFELPYLLWDSLGTRATAELVLRHYAACHPETVARLGRCTVKRRITAGLLRHYYEQHRQSA